MSEHDRPRKVLTISNFSDDDIETLLYASTLFTSVIRQINDNVMLRFSSGYISPALAVPLMAISDELRLLGYTISFSVNELKETHEMAEFFAHSGIHTTMDQDTMELIESVLDKMQIQKQSIWTKEAHKVSLLDIRDGRRGKDQLISDVFNLLLPVYIDRSESSIYKSMVSSMIELYDNAMVHGGGQYIYSMAKEARDKSNIIIVYDNGKGIPCAYREYMATVSNGNMEEKTDQEIIEWAFRRGTSTKQVQEGIPRGLGLPLLLETVNNYHGELGIASGEGICYSKNGNLTYKTVENGMKGTLLIIKVPAI